MTVRYVPEDYADLGTALGACVDGDEIVLRFSTSATLGAGLSSSLDDITIRADDGFTPVLDHTLCGTQGIYVNGGSGWNFQGLRFRSTRQNAGGYALFLDGGTGHVISSCVFEGSEGGIAGDWEGGVFASEFRHTGTVCESSLPMQFVACVFYHCGSSRLLLTSDGIVDNCTFYACRVSFDLVSAAKVRGCTAHACVAEDGAIFKASDVCTKNNAFQCVADSLFVGTTSGNIQVDPQHVQPGVDFRLKPGSALVGAGGLSSATYDRNGEAYLSPKSIGAHESLRIADATADESVSSVKLFVAGGHDATVIAERYQWTIVALDGGLENAVTEGAAFNPGGGEVVGEPFELTAHPGLSGGCSYRLEATAGGYGAATTEFAVADDVEQPDPPAQYRYAAAIMNAMGRQLKDSYGVLDARLVRDFGVGDPVVFVETTQGWPSSGWFFANKILFSYASKTDGAFHGVATVSPRVTIIGAGDRLTHHERSYIPPP